MITMVDVRYCRGNFCLEIPGPLTLGPGFTLVVGPNGAGKSTLLEILATAAAPVQGEIRYGGRRAADDLAGVRGAIGYLPADFQPYAHMSPQRFLQYMATLKGVDPETEVEAGLVRAGLLATRAEKIAGLSQGTKRRLGVAQALLGSPEFLLLDEPLTHVDGRERRYTIEFLTRYAKGRTVVVVSHELDEWEHVDQILWLEEGRIAFVGSPAEWIAGLGEKVWSKALSPKELSQLDPGRTLAWRWTGDRVQVRLFARRAPEDGFREEIPTLQEAYIIRRAQRRTSS